MLVHDRYSQGGDPFGHDWVPAECDVSIRSGWFWHASEVPKSARTLLDIYYKSVGRNCMFLLNVPPNSSGLVSDEDIHVLKEFTELRTSIFSITWQKTPLLLQAVQDEALLILSTALRKSLPKVSIPIGLQRKINQIGHYMLSFRIQLLSMFCKFKSQFTWGSGLLHSILIPGTGKGNGRK